MAKDQQPEDLRPIPDGGLKDTMPGWLKRPPAWRNMPSTEQRHERTLPEPDTSEIDPKTLVDVSDLPQWLQTIAARGDVPVPEPDETIGYALQQLQAASARSRTDEQQDLVPESTIEESEKMVAPEENRLIEEQEPRNPASTPGAPGVQEPAEAESKAMPTPMVLAVVALIAVVIIVAYILV